MGLTMRISVTDRQHVSQQDLRPTVELAPALALPWLARLRYGLLAGISVLILAAAWMAHIQLPLPWIAVPLAIMLVSNILLRRLCERMGARRSLGWTLVVDVLTLTAVLALTGGPANPFTLLYLVQIALSAVVLSKTWTWSLGALSILGFGFLFFFHVHVPALEGHHPAQSYSAHLIGMWIAFVAAAILITLLVGKVSETLRNHEDEVLRLQNLLGRQAKLSSLATLAAGAAHEMGTPLSTIAIVAKELEKYSTGQLPDSHVAAEARLIRSEVERCGKILHAMNTQGAEFEGETPAEIQVSALFQRLRDGFPEHQRNTIQTEAATGLTATLPVETTRQVLAALVRNAIDASSIGQPVRVSGDASQGRLCFTVVDCGDGMPPETLNRIAEPFFTTKGPGLGMGLGTFLVRAFAETLGGTLVFDSAVGRGTTAILELPIAPDIRE